MNIVSQTDLMANQKIGSSLPPAAIFDVLQTSTGDSLFFSIGSDGHLYVTRELAVGETGWDRIDLSSSLTQSNNSAEVIVKLFAACQNPVTGLVDIALVATVQSSDKLYMLRGHSAEVKTWEDTVSWTPLPWDVPQVPSPTPLIISNVYLLVGPSPSDSAQKSVENFFVDVVSNPGDQLDVLTRYYLRPDASVKWNEHQVNMEMTVSSHVCSCLGQPTGHIPGIYTLSIVSETPQVTFASQYNRFGKGPVPSVRLLVPTGTKAIATLPNPAGNTHLLTIGDEGLYIFSPDNQRDRAEPLLVVPKIIMGDLSLFTQIEMISAIKTQSCSAVWVKNHAGTLFNFQCPTGSELEPTAWTRPFPFQLGVTNFAFYLDSETSNPTIFTHMPSLDMVQHRMDITGLWRTREVLLTSSSGADVFSTYNSFTTNISVTDKTGAPVPNVSLTITSQSPVAVNIDNIAYNLSATTPAVVTSDASGVIVVIQETQTISGVTIYAKLTSDSSKASTTNPLDVSHGTLKATTRGDLDNKKITGLDGNSKLLVPSTVTSPEKDSVFSSLQNLMQHPALTKTQKQNASTFILATRSNASASTGFRSSAHHNLELSGDSWFDIAFGDLAHFCLKAVNAIVKPLVQAAKDVWHFVVTIGDDVYHAVINTAEEVFHAVQVVFSKIEVLFDDLISWLGTLFNWKNIVRTHTVISTEITARITTAINAIPTIEDKVEALFDGLEQKVDAWAKFTDPGGDMITQQQKGSDVSSQASSAKSNWAMYHAKNGMGSVSASATLSTSFEKSSSLEDALADLASLGETISSDIGDAVSQIKTQVVDVYSSLSALDIVTKVIAILGNLILKSTKDVIIKLLAVVKALATDALGLLREPLPIPVLSTIYKTEFGTEMTVLDLVCLVTAIPVTVVYEFVNGKAPFPDDGSVAAAAAASDSRRQIQQTLLSNLSPLSTDAPLHQEHDSSTEHKSDHNLYETNTIAAPGILKSATPLQAGDIVTIIFDIAAVPGVGITLLAAEALRKNPSPKMRMVGFAGAMLYMAPGYEVWPATDTWPNNINIALGCVCAVKALVDAVCLNEHWLEVSPVLDFEINAVSLVAAIGGFKALTSPKAADDTMFAASLCYDLAGILAPEVGKQPEIRYAQDGLNCVYGILCAVTAKLYYNENS